MTAYVWFSKIKGFVHKIMYISHGRIPHQSVHTVRIITGKHWKEHFKIVLKNIPQKKVNKLILKGNSYLEHWNEGKEK